MGYRTDFLLEASPVTEELFEEIDVAIMKRNGYFCLHERSLVADKGRWDMHYIGEVTDGIVDFLLEKGHRIYRPAIVTEPDGTQHIEEYEVKENEGNEA